MIEILRKAKTEKGIKDWYKGIITKDRSDGYNLCVKVLESDGAHYLYYTRKDGFWIYQMMSQTNYYE